MKMSYSSHFFYLLMIVMSISMWYLILFPFERHALQNISTFSWRWWGRPSEPPPRRFGYFLHITDLHVDESYLPGATIESDCHRPPKSYQLQRSSTSSSSSYSSMALAGSLGSPGQHCDSPIELAQQTLNWIKKEWKHKLDFVVWTGDNARHDWDDQRRRKKKHIFKLNEMVQEMMVETFWPTAEDPRHIPLVPAIGNNDVHPHNYIGGMDDDHGILSFYSQLWHSWIPSDQQPTFQAGGYFAVDVGRQLRVISLNTMYFYSKNDAVHGCHKPGLAQRHMQWYEQQLAKARSESFKVYVMGHVPPSPRDYRRTCFQDYTRISAAYPEVIRGHFFGHLNMDHFLMYDGRENELLFSTTTADNASLLFSPPGDSEDNDYFCINRNIDKYVDWLRDMYSSIDPPSPKERSPLIQTPLVVVQVAPSVLPVYLPAIRIYRYEINDRDDDQVYHHNTAATTDDEKKINSLPRPHGTLLSYQQFYANITEWENSDNHGPLQYQLEYDTHEEYGLMDLTVDSYYQFAKDMIEAEEEEDDDNQSQRNSLWTKFIQNMFVQTMNDDLA